MKIVKLHLKVNTCKCVRCGHQILDQSYSTMSLCAPLFGHKQIFTSRCGVWTKIPFLE